VSSLLAEGQGVGAATPGMRSCPLRLLLTRGSSPVGRSKEASPHGGRRLLRFAACAQYTRSVPGAFSSVYSRNKRLVRSYSYRYSLLLELAT
jgi:hypothetical protein